MTKKYARIPKMIKNTCYVPKACPTCGEKTATVMSDTYNCTMVYCTNRGAPMFRIPECGWRQYHLDIQSEIGEMKMTTILGEMKRQWPENTIMPATARHRMEFWYYGEIEHNLKGAAEDGTNQRKAVEKHVNWLMIQIQIKVRSSYFKQNGHVFRLVAQNDIGQMAEDIYSKMVVKTTQFYGIENNEKAT